MSLRMAFVALMLMQAAPPSGASGEERAYGTHEYLAHSETEEVTESSGIAPSHFDADIFWTHNDSGKYPRVYAFRLSAADRERRVAKDLGYVELRGARCVDWEDMAAGPGMALYILDGGDNPPCKRNDKRIYRFVEPDLSARTPPVRMTIPCESIRFEYPDPDRPERPATKNEHRYDAETLLVHPKTNDLYIVTKRNNAGKAMARVYRLPARAIRPNARSIHVLEFVADISGRAPGMLTGGDVSPDGWRVVLRGYLGAYEFELPEGRPFETIFEQRPRLIGLVGEPQGEAICYARNGDLITTSESIVGGPRFPIFITPVATRPAGAPGP